MKKVLSIFICVCSICFLFACTGMSISNETYAEISAYITENYDEIVTKDEVEFFRYDSTGLSTGGVYYGYYYSINNEILVPDFYAGNNLEEKYDSDGGTYFGKPNSGTDWCFVKKISENWYYYELHWG